MTISNPIAGRDLGALRTAVAGDVFAQGDHGYDEARRAWNLTTDERPAVVVAAESAADVVQAVRFARSRGMRIAPQGTGHGSEPLEPLEGAMLLRTVRMRGVRIDPAARIARAEAGALWQDVTVPAGQHGLAALAGSSANVGVTGYTLGGGMGFLARRYGLAANSVTAAEIVTPDGRLRHAGAGHEPDLFWAVKGGSVGVVTALRMRLYPVRALYAGALFFPVQRAAEVLHAWRAWTGTVPDEVTSLGRILRLPPLPEVPERLRGRAFTLVEAAYLGDAAAGAGLIGVRDLYAGVVGRAFESTRQGVPMTDVPSQLTWDVYVTAEEPIATDDLPPGATERRWPPISATLISAERDAVLVDPLMTAAQARGLGDWVAASGKNLTAVFVTHGHGDHWFGLSMILDRFPGSRAFAVPGVVEKMRRGSTPEYLAAFWNPRLPGKIADRIVLADPLPGHSIELEGHQLVAVELGHTDMDTTSCLHVPEIGLVVAGDAVYNDVHLHLSESDHKGRLDWLAALRAIESLHPKAVVAGHKRATRDDDPRIIGETRQYIHDFNQIVETTTTACDLYDQVLKLHPGRLNPGALWTSARAFKP